MGRVLKVVAWVVAALAVAVVAFDIWYVHGHTLKTAEMAQIIAASAAAVAAMAGVVSAVAAATAAGRSEETARAVRVIGEQATEAASRAMLPDSIDAQVRIEPFAPRTVIFSVNTDQRSWTVLRAVRRGQDGPEPVGPVPGITNAVGWQLPDAVVTKGDFDAWLSMVDLDVMDVRRLAQWTIHGAPLHLTYPSPPSDPLDSINAPVLYHSVQAQAARRTASSS